MSRKESGEGFLAALKHAFAIPARQPLNEREIGLLNRLAQAIGHRRLATPALLTLEGMLPLSFISSQALAFFKPVISIVFRPELVDEVVQLLQNPRALRKLEQLIRSHQVRPGQAPACEGQQ